MPRFVNKHRRRRKVVIEVHQKTPGDQDGDEDRAADAFERWRDARVVTNVTGIGGLIFPPLWFGTAGAALYSADPRDDLVAELRMPDAPAA